MTRYLIDKTDISVLSFYTNIFNFKLSS